VEPVDAMGDFAAVALPAEENEMSRRYLRVIERWVPVAMSYYNDWPGRPDCGHFFGGVLWYGQETAMPIMTLALAASSGEFDPAAGRSAEELRAIALQGLRYLCFTHDTGPEDCIRPEKSWGRTEPAGTKWGERGRGFFPESQCGRTIAELAITAALIRDLLGDEERRMLANIAADYLDRFGDMEPRAGVYFDTQMEENGWTAEGLTASMLLLPGHPRLPEWQENARLWMFRTATMPRDAHDHAEFADGKTVSQLCGRRFTMLPDGTAENHGFVHPNYLASGLSLAGRTINLLRLFGQAVPPHLFWHRQDLYDTMKPWFDGTGSPHPAQGMDWPYTAYPAYCSLHACASVYLGDADAARLERQALEVVERSSAAHGGRMVPQEQADHCHGQQDPALMRERMTCLLAAAYHVHRLAGAGPTPPDPADFETRAGGVHVYPHGGVVLHRHAQGITSFAWRNRTMVLPSTREGLRLIGPAGGSMLATIDVQGKAPNTKPVALKIREEDDRAAVLRIEDLAEGSVRRQVMFASLPGGKCVIAERLVAREPITVERVRQGYLSIINDGYFAEHDDLRGRRTLYWDGGRQTFAGYVTDSDGEDVVLDLGDARWVNVDDRFGLVFESTGRAFYHNQHHYEVWHATEDELVLSQTDEAQRVQPGQPIARMVAVWCPGQPHEETAREPLCAHAEPSRIEIEVDGVRCTCDFEAGAVALR